MFWPYQILLGAKAIMYQHENRTKLVAQIVLFRPNLSARIFAGTTLGIAPRGTNEEIQEASWSLTGNVPFLLYNGKAEDVHDRYVPVENAASVAENVNGRPGRN